MSIWYTFFENSKLDCTVSFAIVNHFTLQLQQFFFNCKYPDTELIRENITFSRKTMISLVYEKYNENKIEC